MLMKICFLQERHERFWRELVKVGARLFYLGWGQKHSKVAEANLQWGKTSKYLPPYKEFTLKLLI